MQAHIVEFKEMNIRGAKAVNTDMDGFWRILRRSRIDLLTSADLTTARANTAVPQKKGCLVSGVEIMPLKHDPTQVG